ncbi:hypothetical protein E3E11_01260 [Oecophyllibacter saccharovorans]|uniref:hypothetical protein n=1 Tax=Oecophyllibacter saccharovorans TaxID=2558360 RepID=UPI0011425A2B|nr:hypothetical protein [Oecophyllibacter saccharovorans]QDH14711.1 hypothetical protein E3E11_01260 [Oecophyllibacter saccharovorans]
MLKKRSSASRALLARGFLVLPLLAGCTTNGQKPEPPNRQNLTLVRPSDVARLLPEETSLRRQYHPPLPRAGRVAPDSRVAYEAIPNMSYADNSLDDNLAGSIELADYYTMAVKAGWQRWLQGGGPYTVLAMPNQQIEALSRSWPGQGMLDPVNYQRLKFFIGQTILVGKWTPHHLRKKLATPEARRAGGVIQTRTLTGEPVSLRLLPGDVIQISNREGSLRIGRRGYKQSNGVFYVTDRELY